MVRHKVLPGITGWAQVNGCRGETTQLQEMEARVNYDLDYLRHWSPMLDFKIILTGPSSRYSGTKRPTDLAAGAAVMSAPRGKDCSRHELLVEIGTRPPWAAPCAC